ncbi:MAG: hypothetical protein HY355_02470, partial [Armatimonadetes bacterium]|nr:hypothetical protein [Armatimonadota bacterium]
RLQTLSGPSALSAWQLHIVREEYKPRPVLLVVPAAGSDPARVTSDARSKLLEIDVLRLGIEHRIVLDPEVRLAERLEEERTWSGKPRRVIDRSVSGGRP